MDLKDEEEEVAPLHFWRTRRTRGVCRVVTISRLVSKLLLRV